MWRNWQWLSLGSLLMLIVAMLWSKNPVEDEETRNSLSWIYLFNHFDANHDSFLCQDEFNHLMKRLRDEFLPNSFLENTKLQVPVTTHL